MGDSGFSPKRVLSTERSPAIPVIGSGNFDKDASANRFKYDSLPKKTIKKNFGTETRHLGFVKAVSSFQQNQPLSTSNSCPVAKIGVGMEATVDR